MTLRKIITLVIVVPIALVIVASALFIATFDANLYKQDMADLVKQKTGRTLTISGDANLMLFPALGMKLGAMSLSNAPGFASKPMLKIKQVSVSVDVKSVLMMKPKISELILDGLQVDLQKNKQGKTNWQDLVDQQAPAQTATTTPPEKPQQSSESESAKESSDIAFKFDGLKISNAQLHWNDQLTGDDIELIGLNIKTGSITEKTAFPITLDFLLQKKNEISADLVLNTQFQFNQKNQTLRLSNTQLNVDATGSLLPFDQAKTELKGNIEFALNSQILSVSQLGLLANLQGEDLPKGAVISQLSSEHLQLELPKRQVSIKALKLELNGQTLRGDVQVQDYAKPAVSFKLVSDSLDIDDMLGLSNEEAATPIEQTTSAEKESATQDVAIKLPMRLLRSLQLDGDVEIAQLKVKNLKLSKVQLKVLADKGVIKVNPLATQLYQGSINNEIMLDATAAKPAYTADINLTSVQIEPLLQDFMQMDKISGATTAAIQLKTQGEMLSALKHSLNGNIALKLQDGAVKGLNLRQISNAAKARLAGKPEPKETVKKTDFSAMSLSANIKNGIAYSDDLKVEAPLLRVTGKGSVNLNDNTLDYQVDSDIINSLEGQSGENKGGLYVPVRIYGAFSDIKINVLIDDLLKKQAAEALAKEKAKLQKQLEAKKAQLEAEKAAYIAKQKAALQQKQAELEAKKRAAQQQAQQKLAAEKLKLQQAQQAAKLKLQQKQAAEKARLQAELDAKKRATEEKLKKAAEDKLKNLFK